MSHRAISRLVRLCLAAGWLMTASVATAQPAGSAFLEDLTWTELRDQIRLGKTTVLVPIGGTEQNGPHMALGKHNARVRLLAGKIALSLGNALVAPVIAYVPEGSIDPPQAHLRFPGTITVPRETFQKTLEYAARSFRLHGFADVVFLGDHGGYQADEKAVADRLNREWSAAPVRVHAITEYYQVTRSEYVQLLQARGFKDSEIGNHAGLADTSLMLATDPGAVRTDRLRSEASRSPADGVSGDPGRASAELGQAGVELIVARTVEAVRKAVQRR